MDIDQIYHRFDTLEDRVSQLIEICDLLKIEKIELQNRVDELEKEIEIKLEAEKHQINQRETIRDKVDGLLRKLGEFSELS